MTHPPFKPSAREETQRDEGQRSLAGSTYGNWRPASKAQPYTPVAGTSDSQAVLSQTEASAPARTEAYPGVYFTGQRKDAQMPGSSGGVLGGSQGAFQPLDVVQNSAPPPAAPSASDSHK